MVSPGAIGLLLVAAFTTGGCDRQSPAAVQANLVSPDEALAPAAGSARLVTGKVDRSHRGEAAPAVAFESPSGKPVTLAAFRGRPLLVNLWATWCAPCVAELPTLDAAAKTRAGTVTVIAVSQDLDAAIVAPFLARRGVKALAPYRDPRLALSVAYGANLPTTVFYDAGGRELWRVTGGLDWTGAEAMRLLTER